MNEIPLADSGAKTENINLSRKDVEQGALMGRLAKAMAGYQSKNAEQEKSTDVQSEQKTESTDVREVLQRVIQSDQPLDDKTRAEIWIKLSIVKNNRAKIEDLDSAINQLAAKIGTATGDEKVKLIGEQHTRTVEAALLRKDTFTLEQIVAAKGVPHIAETMAALDAAGIF
ncbi:MAG: hypothetical protein A2848_01630 [Candidatus Magasanikbacteria bacterium RIFCSPHIGHO2_01_FULL_50_8]|uniref:Uncharacterized protein n=2 Tax=Candidatus Magasanikiibacteriota TaxID=1752731 RepID=A0A1F6LQV5_9BACT|nr:MAG: hypothetical protein A2848_01630 [Candidatus Magasanikbacteria bacterium RIFCSPHIGHO2_01_FULL_50_8]OGH68248.1 MAG: hypothetical protein A3C15_03835 [Candidatus Magasanikbacteria bacterium RIFCSPHIGHO2_02_FULL_50_9b]